MNVGIVGAGVAGLAAAKVLSERGHQVTIFEGRHEVGPGDVVLHPPGAPHQTMAAADGELECLIIADNPPVEICHYPDSNKWGINPGAQYFRTTAVDYYDGEE